MILTGRTISPRPLTAVEKRAVVAMQAHLRCEDLLSGKSNGARMDRRTVAGLQIYQRLQMIADNGSIDLETRTALLGDSREQDFRALLRALRERVVDATGLIEDGSALGVQGEVQGRMLDSAEFRPLPVQAGGTQEKPAVPAAAEGKVTPAPDLIAAATQAASQALGWTSPEAVLASTLVVAPAPPPSSRRPARKAPASKAPAPLPAAVAIRLPPLPAYHSPKMDLRAELDRGEVVMKRPALDKEGHKKWHPPVSDRPTLTLYARVGKGEVALGRWPTTIGGWKTIEKSDGSMALKYKESVTGDAIWPEVLATPTWHPATGIPTRKLLIKRGDTWEPKTEIIGPGYRAAYGLVALVHHQIEGVDEHGQPQLMDHRIRTHGTPAYRSVKRGESNGCHRLHNYVVLRLTGFLVKHRENVRDGLVPEDYVRNLEYKGQKVALAEREQGLPIQADAARAGDRPYRRRPRKGQCRQGLGAAERGPVGAGSDLGQTARPRLDSFRSPSSHDSRRSSLPWDTLAPAGASQTVVESNPENSAIRKRVRLDGQHVVFIKRSASTVCRSPASRGGYGN